MHACSDILCDSYESADSLARVVHSTRAAPCCGTLSVLPCPPGIISIGRAPSPRGYRRSISTAQLSHRRRSQRDEDMASRTLLFRPHAHGAWARSGTGAVSLPAPSRLERPHGLQSYGGNASRPSSPCKVCVLCRSSIVSYDVHVQAAAATGRGSPPSVASQRHNHVLGGPS